MAKQKRRTVAVDEAAPSIPVANKIAGLLALIATKDMDTDDAALKLDAIGFDAREISALLDVGPNYVNVARHRKKSTGKKQKNRAG
jgi:hypothetical protein